MLIVRIIAFGILNKMSFESRYLEMKINYSSFMILKTNVITV